MVSKIEKRITVKLITALTAEGIPFKVKIKDHWADHVFIWAKLSERALSGVFVKYHIW